MIDEDRTMQIYGYYGGEVSKCSKKRVITVCEGCGKYRDTRRCNYSALCKSCAKTGVPQKSRSEEAKHRMSDAAKKRPRRNVASRMRMSESQKIRPPDSDETRKKKSDAARRKPAPTRETRVRISAKQPGIPIEDWTGFTHRQKYCRKFNEVLKEMVRNKYGRQCFLCGREESDNGRRLSVHHIDMDKDAGCNGNGMKLVPLCTTCHAPAHKPVWTQRIQFLLNIVWNSGTFI